MVADANQAKRLTQMKLDELVVLAIDRSTDVQSVAVARAGKVQAQVFEGMDARSGVWPVKVRDFLTSQGLTVADVQVFLVGQGPGSFAGIRAALGFAQGLALPGNKRVSGLPSAAALAHTVAGKLAVVGDARRGRYWSVLYDNGVMVRDFVLATADELAAVVLNDYPVMTSDGARITELLQATFGARYVGTKMPMAADLLGSALAHPAALHDEPLPIYLQAAVK